MCELVDSQISEYLVFQKFENPEFRIDENLKPWLFGYLETCISAYSKRRICIDRRYC
jgi:hypothetical protein